jgi:excisionase family DNA binding protein
MSASDTHRSSVNRCQVVGQVRLSSPCQGASDPGPPRSFHDDQTLPDEAAEQLRVSRWTVYNLIRSNQLRTVKIGRRRLVTLAALVECVESRGEVA